MSNHDEPTTGPGDGPPMREVSLRLELLDVQVLDAGDLPVGRVDDLELEVSGAEGAAAGPGGLMVTALLIGQRHLGPRVGGLTGEALERTALRLAQRDDDGRLAPAEVASWTGLLKLRHHLADLPLAPLEKWLSTRVVGRIPRSSDEGI